MAAANSAPADDLENDEGATKAQRPDLPDAARRALAEAEERRARDHARPEREFAGRGGLDPVRYGDWEVKGLASDF
jgi:hypothetical protein